MPILPSRRRAVVAIGAVLVSVATLVAIPPSRAATVTISMGSVHTCAVHAGTVRCWGTALAGGLGGPETQRVAPREVPNVTDAVAVAVGASHGCALRATGAIRCWGGGTAGQLGQGSNASSPTPVDVTGLTGPAIAIATANNTSCAAITGGTVQCWGSDASGLLGNGPASTVNVNIASPVLGLTGVTAISAGSAHFCVVQSSGAARCWGDGTAGQLGDGSFVVRDAPVAVASIAGVQAITAGQFHSCARTSSGPLRCWGNNLFGQLGTGDFAPSATPVAVTATSSTGVVAIDAGGRHTCVRRADGGVFCWGRGYDGQLGIARNTLFEPLGVAMQGLPAGTPQELAAGSAGTCVRYGVEDIRCVGLGHFGQLGDGVFRRAPFPVAVPYAPDAQLAFGVMHTCVRSGGVVRCVGFNGGGALGDGTTERRLSPVTTIASSPAGAVVVASETQTCHHVPNTATSQCWGRNDNGQLGTAAVSAQQTTPIAAPSLGTGRIASQLALGTFFSCALVVESGTRQVRCWGRNAFGQLGNGGSAETTAPNATPVSGLVDPVQVVAGETHACALESNGVAKCWGLNTSGQLGIGALTPQTSPTALAVAGVTQADRLVAGRDGRHTCALMADASVRCWGLNANGQVGNGVASAAVTTAATVTGLGTTAQLAAGSGHTCARSTGGAVRCWGSGNFDQLGNDTLGALLPVDVPTLASGVLDLDGGALHTCARRATGWTCWGFNAHGGLGVGGASVALLPVRVAPLGTLLVDGFE